MFSKFFIDRPVLAAVLSIVIVLVGLAAMQALPVAQYPDIVPPQVQVTASYPGADPQVIADTVAAPLEQAINGVQHMLYMNSSSTSAGDLSLSISFAIGTNPEQAAIEVNNRIQSALPTLPEEVRRQGVKVDKRSSSLLEVVALYSPDGSYDPIFISNFALLNILDELKRTPGVGEAVMFGAKDYSMRVWLRPDKLAQFGLTPADVAAAIREQNEQFAAGQFGQEPLADHQAFTYNVRTPSRLDTPEAFGDIILRADGRAAALRLRDVARVELGARDYSVTCTFNGKPAIAIRIALAPGANALATAAAVRETMERTAERFPGGLAYAIPFDTTTFVKVSIEEVLITFAEALILVVAVVFLFLQQMRATLIPLLAVPVSLIGTLAGMYLLGFSINLLTLFGMILSIGIVVDDAIVVLENVERLMRQEGKKPYEAALQAMREVSGPVVAVVLVLAAVFVPVGFMGGMTGEMYKQFAITIAVSVAISGFVALTLTPALCVLFLKPEHHAPGPLFARFNRFFDRETERYTGAVRFFLDRPAAGFALLGVIVAGALLLYGRVPSALVPEEDQGYILVAPTLPPASSLARTEVVTAAMDKQLRALPQVQNVVAFAGFDLMNFGTKTSTGVTFVMLKDWGERTEAQSDSRHVARTIMANAASIKDAFVLAFNPPPITGISPTGGFEAYLQDRSGNGAQALAETVQRVVEAARARPELTGVTSTFNASVPQYRVQVDRLKAKALGVPIASVFQTMQSVFGSLYVNDFSLYGRPFRVSLSAEGEFREKPDDLRHAFVRSAEGQMIPLDALVTLTRVVAPDTIDRFNLYPAAKLLGGPAPGYSSGQALQALEDVVAETVPHDYALGWIGSAFQERLAGRTAGLSIGFGVILVFLILAAQYGRWRLPLAVLSAVPFAIFGALLATWMRGLQNDIYFQVGVLTLIGLSAKNAILIVEFAVLKAKEGMPLREAAEAAARLRFRPIIMTSLAFIFGCIPLAISSGAGSASRHSIGTGVIGGMIAATLIAILVVPLFYTLIAKKRGER